MNDDPYCGAQVGGMECGRSVKNWGEQCAIHDPIGETLSQDQHKPFIGIQEWVERYAVRL